MHDGGQAWRNDLFSREKDEPHISNGYDRLEDEPHICKGYDLWKMNLTYVNLAISLLPQFISQLYLVATHL